MNQLPELSAQLLNPSFTYTKRFYDQGHPEVAQKWRYHRLSSPFLLHQITKVTEVLESIGK